MQRFFLIISNSFFMYILYTMSNGYVLELPFTMSKGVAFLFVNIYIFNLSLYFHI